MPAALIVAAAVTALVALGMVMVALQRRSRLTVVKVAATALASAAVVALAVVGVVAVSPVPAQAVPDDGGTSVTLDDDGMVTDFQLPTLGLDD